MAQPDCFAIARNDRLNLTLALRLDFYKTITL